MSGRVPRFSETRRAFLIDDRVRHVRAVCAAPLDKRQVVAGFVEVVEVGDIATLRNQIIHTVVVIAHWWSLRYQRTTRPDSNDSHDNMYAKNVAAKLPSDIN